MRRLAAALILCCLALPVRAQFAADTSAAVFRASQLIAPAVLGGAALALHFGAHESVEIPVNEWFTSTSESALPFIETAGNIGQYVPSALHLGLGLAGVKSKRPFADRVIESAIAHAISIGAGYAIKYSFKVQRPDGGYKSFPSGHTLMAFTGAELMRIDYGNGIGAGAYVFSAAVGASRLAAGRHWLSDLLAGAGIGILSAHAGEWLLQPVKNLLGLPEFSWDGCSSRPVSIALLPGADPVSGTPTVGAAVVF